MRDRPADVVHVVIATPFGENGKGGVDRMMDVIRHHVADHPDPAFEVRFVVSRGPGSIWLSPFYLVWAILSLIFYRLTGRLDVFHVNIVQKGSTLRKLTLCYVARVLGAPYILHLHGSQYRQYWDAAGPFLAARIRAVFRKAKRVLVLGAVWSDYIRLQAPEARLEILPNATFSPPVGREHKERPEPTHILFLGQVGARKGVPELIEALRQIADAPHWRATLAGNGQVEEARQQVAAGNLSGRVILTGWAGPSEVEQLLGEADILVLPSHDENLPLSVIEGMAYGLAVVTTPVGAVTDIIAEGETGLLCPPGDPAALSVALRRVVSDSGLRARLGKAARDFHTERLTVDSYVGRLKSIWADVSLSK